MMKNYLWIVQDNLACVYTYYYMCEELVSTTYFLFYGQTIIIIFYLNPLICRKMTSDNSKFCLKISKIWSQKRPKYLIEDN